MRTETLKPHFVYADTLLQCKTAAGKSALKSFFNGFSFTPDNGNSEWSGVCVKKLSNDKVSNDTVRPRSISASAEYDGLAGSVLAEQFLSAVLNPLLPLSGLFSIMDIFNAAEAADTVWTTRKQDKEQLYASPVLH